MGGWVHSVNPHIFIYSYTRWKCVYLIGIVNKCDMTMNNNDYILKNKSWVQLITWLACTKFSFSKSLQIWGHPSWVQLEEIKCHWASKITCLYKCCLEDTMVPKSFWPQIGAFWRVAFRNPGGSRWARTQRCGVVQKQGTSDATQDGVSGTRLTLPHEATKETHKIYETQVFKTLHNQAARHRDAFEKGSVSLMSALLSCRGDVPGHHGTAGGKQIKPSGLLKR